MSVHIQFSFQNKINRTIFSSSLWLKIQDLIGELFLPNKYFFFFLHFHCNRKKYYFRKNEKKKYRWFRIVSCLHNKKIRLILKSTVVPRNHLLKLKLNMETKWFLSSCALLWKNNQWNGAISKSVLNSPFTFFLQQTLNLCMLVDKILLIPDCHQLWL